MIDISDMFGSASVINSDEPESDLSRTLSPLAP